MHAVTRGIGLDLHRAMTGEVEASHRLVPTEIRREGCWACLEPRTLGSTGREPGGEQAAGAAPVPRRTTTERTRAMNAITDLPAQGLTRQLAAQARALTLGEVPEDIRAWARQCVLDYLACTLAGAQDELTTILLAEMQEQGGKGAATIMGHGVKLPAAAAALVNGAAAHALDYDDVNLAMPGHPSVAILPALLALAEERGATGAKVLTAFVAGYELQCRIGRLLAPGHYDGLGFHATATVGSFGSAAACAHLMGLNAEQCAIALGIAGTQAAGLKAMFGTMCKPLHAGKASYHGLMAAKLAARGFTSRPDVIECAQGFAQTHSPDFNPDQALETPPQGWYIRNNLFKYHAACYMVHASIEAARQLRAQHGITPDRIARIRVELDEACARICNIAAPQTGLEAKFSVRLATAMGLSGVDTGRLSTYSAEAHVGFRGLTHPTQDLTT